VKLNAEKVEKIRKAIEKEAEKKEEATNNVNAHLMDFSNFDKEESGEEKDGAPKTLFDGEEESNSPAHKRTKHSLGALKLNLQYTKYSMARKKGSSVQHTMFINFGVTLTADDKSGEFAIKIKDLLMNLQLLDKTASFVELLPRNKHQPKIISQ